MAQQLQKLFTRLFVGGMSLSVGAFTLSQSLYVGKKLVTLAGSPKNYYEILHLIPNIQ
jgi:hypothetical protein